MASQLASLTNQQALYSNHKTYVGEPQSSCQIVCVLWLGVGPLETLSSHANVLIDFAIVELLFMHPFLGLTVSHRLPGIICEYLIIPPGILEPFNFLFHTIAWVITVGAMIQMYPLELVSWSMSSEVFFVILFLCDDH